MGQYLSAPVTEKESADGENERLAFGLSAMQGWRVSMEDAHISLLDVDKKNSALFSVFDGHGGKAVAKFAAKHMPEELVKLDSYRRGDIGVAIAEAYYKLDELLDTEEGKAELKALATASIPPGKKNQGLFTDIEIKLSESQSSAVDNVISNATDAVNEAAAAATGEAKATPPKPLPRVDSSEKFMQSALMRNSVILPHGALEPLTSGLPSEEGGAVETSGKLSSKLSKDGEDEEESEEEEDDERGHHATGMGCTAVSVLIRADNGIIVANTGDSRAVISRRGEAAPLTLDHKPVIYEEAQRIIRAGGFVRDNRVNGALNVSRTIGDLDFKRNSELPHTEQMVVATPDITELKLQEGDEFLIIACDGIWDVLSNQEAVDFVRKRVKQGVSLKSICEAMCDECLAPDLKGLCRGADNMSVIIVLFKETANLNSFWSKMWNSIAGPCRKLMP